MVVARNGGKGEWIRASVPHPSGPEFTPCNAVLWSGLTCQESDNLGVRRWPGFFPNHGSEVRPVGTTAAVVVKKAFHG